MIKYIWCKICHFNHLQCTIQCVNHIHTVVQPSLFCVSKSFLSPQTETINTRAISPISLTSQPLVTSPLLSVSTNLLCFPPGSLVKKSACQCKRCRFDSWFEKNPWRRKWHPTPLFLPGESCGQRSLVGYRPWGWGVTKQSDTTEHKLNNDISYK